MLAKTRGIVFRSVKYGETSLILDIYTRELGLRSYIINGVRRNKARTSAGILQVMSLVDLVVYEQENRDINRIKEVKPFHLFQNLPYDIHKSSVGIFLLEMARNSIREKEANATVYDFLEAAFLELDQTTQPVSSFHISFLVHFSEVLGFQPEENYTTGPCYFDMREGNFVSNPPFHRDYLGTNESHALIEYMKKPLEGFHTVVMDKNIKMQLLDGLVDYYRIHLGDFGKLRSLEIFRDLFKH